MNVAPRFEHQDDLEEIDPGRRLIRLDEGGTSLAERVAAQLRHLVWRTPLHRVRLRGQFPLKLLAVPADPIPGDRLRGMSLLEGRLLYHGEEIALADLDFATLQASDGFTDYLQSFEWLRDLGAAASREEAVPVAERMMRNWLEAHSAKVAEKSWRADIWGRRVLLWTSYAPLILSSNDLVYRSSVLNALAQGARHLDRVAPKADTGNRQIAAWSGVIGAGLLVQGGEARVARGEAGLARALQKALTADGGMICRSPASQLALIELLAMLRAAYDVRRTEFPQPFATALSFAVPALLGITHGDGGLASWQGCRPTPAKRVNAAIEASGHRALPLKRARDWGYQRLSGGETVVIIDAAPPPSSRLETGGCASTLAFELSHGPHRIVVNCGGAGGTALPERLARGLRTTAAHSTLTLADRNSTALHPDGSLGKGVGAIELDFAAPNGVSRLEASHDGYVQRLGFVHRRQLALSAEGSELRGEDVLLPAGRKRRQTHEFAIRFHLGADVEAALTADGSGALLRVAGGPAWHFRCRGVEAMLEESVWIDEKARPRPTQQLVLAGVAEPGGSSIGWLFRRAA